MELLGGMPLVGQLGLFGALIVVPWTLLAYVVRRVVNGELTARQTLTDAQADRDHWRTAADKWQEVSSKQGMTLERLLEYAETANHALTEIQAGPRRSEDPQ